MRKNNRKNLVFLLPLRSIIFLLVFIIAAEKFGKPLSGISCWWSIVATIVNIFTILLLVYAARKNNMTYRQLINYQEGETKAGQVVVMTLLILLIGMGGMYLAGFLCYGVIPYAAPMMIAPIPKLLAIINLPLLPVSTAFAEDGLYLGCGVNSIENKFRAVIVPAFFFALQHCFIPTLLEPRYVIYRFISFLPCAIFLCWHYYKKRNPLPIMIGHAVIDVATVMQILATSMIPGFYEMMLNM